MRWAPGRSERIGGPRPTREPERSSSTPSPSSPSSPVVARAPVRVSFGGGGTDLPAYYEAHGGFVVSAAIARACLVSAAPSPDGRVGINSADYRRWVRFDPRLPIDLDEPLSLPKAAVAWFLARGALRDGVDLFLAAEVPPGSGLGSSSAMAVALVRALAEWSGWAMTSGDAAAAACEIELGLLGRPIGKQDQYAASFGGISAIAFERDGVTVEPLALPPGTPEALAERLLLFSTGRTRDSAGILGRQRAETANGGATAGRLHRIKALAREMRDALLVGDLDRFGALLDDGWRLKRGLTGGISNDAIDRWYARAREAGAEGGKIAGAGGGGFLLLCVPPARRAAVEAAMAEEGLCPLAFGFDRAGARVIRMDGDESSRAADRAAALTGGA